MPSELTATGPSPFLQMVYMSLCPHRTVSFLRARTKPTSSLSASLVPSQDGWGRAVARWILGESLEGLAWSSYITGSRCGVVGAGHRRGAPPRPAPASSCAAATIPSEQHHLSTHRARRSPAERPPSRAAPSCGRPRSGAMQAPAPDGQLAVPVRVPTPLPRRGPAQCREGQQKRK